MRVLGNYLKLEAKRSFFVLNKSIGSMICVLLAVGAIVTAMYFLLMETTIFPKIQVGVVVPEKNTVVELITNYISSMESVESICDFHYVDYDTGKSMLISDDLQVVVVLPANLYEDLNNWQKVQATILLPEEESVGVRMFGEVLASGLGLLQVAEAGIISTYEIAEGQSLLMNRHEIGYFLGMKYVGRVLDRMDSFENLVISPTGTMTMVQFYFLGAVLCLCLISGLQFQYLYEKRERALQSKLQIEGVGRVQQMIVRIVLMSVYVLLLEVTLYGMGCVLSEVLELYALHFSWSAVVGMVVLALAMSVHFHMVYALGHDERQGAVILLITGIGMVLCAGLIVPSAYLPKPARVLGEMLPLHGWSLLGQEALYGNICESVPVAPLTWILIELGIGGYLSWQKH